MGDRGNVVLHFGTGNGGTNGREYDPVYLYTHWGGTELPGTLADALKRGGDRWGDAPYLARIIFSEMVKDAVLEETGFGLAPYECDNEHPLLHVYLQEQEVEVESEGRVGFAEFVVNFATAPAH